LGWVREAWEDPPGFEGLNQHEGSYTYPVKEFEWSEMSAEYTQRILRYVTVVEAQIDEGLDRLAQ
jgi:hypothetical protein